jgi:hypothetical protein
MTFNIFCLQRRGEALPGSLGVAVTQQQQQQQQQQQRAAAAAAAAAEREEEEGEEGNGQRGRHMNFAAEGLGTEIWYYIWCRTP